MHRQKQAESILDLTKDSLAHMIDFINQKKHDGDEYKFRKSLIEIGLNYFEKFYAEDSASEKQS